MQFFRFLTTFSDPAEMLFSEHSLDGHGQWCYTSFYTRWLALFQVTSVKAVLREIPVSVQWKNPKLFVQHL